MTTAFPYFLPICTMTVHKQYSKKYVCIYKVAASYTFPICILTLAREGEKIGMGNRDWVGGYIRTYALACSSGMQDRHQSTVQSGNTSHKSLLACVVAMEINMKSNS